MSREGDRASHTGRKCGCGTRLSVWNTSPRCAVCERMYLQTMTNNEPPVMPYEFWVSSRFRDAFKTRDMGKLLRLFRTAEVHRDQFGPDGITQELLGTWLGLAQAQVSGFERGKKDVDSISKMIEWAEILSIPNDLLWFDLTDSSRLSNTEDTEDTEAEAPPARTTRIEPNMKLRAAREATPSPTSPGFSMSRTELAEAVNEHLWHTTNKVHTSLDSKHIGRFERGQISWPTASYRAALRAVLGASTDAELGFYPKQGGSSTRVPLEEAPIARRSLLASSGATALEVTLASPHKRTIQALEIVAAEDADSLDVAIECLNELVPHYSSMLSTSSPDATYDDLLQCRQYSARLLNGGSSPETQRRELTINAGWLSNLLAVATSYMGDHSSALIWCIDAERHSKQSGNKELAAWAAFTRAMIAYYQGEMQRSIEATNAGQQIAPIGSVARAKLAAHEMRAQAMHGNSDDMLAAKQNATKAIADLPASAAKNGVFSIALSEDPPYTATSLLLSGRFKEASAVTREVLHNAYPGEKSNSQAKSSNYARTLLILSLSEAGLGNIDEATSVGRAALDTDNLVWPTLVLAGKLNRALRSSHKESAAVAEYHDVYRDALNEYRTLTAAVARP